MLFFIFFSCETENVSKIEASEFKVKIENSDVQLLDVRTLKEFDEGHISNAILIDVKGDYFLSKSEEKLIKGKPIYIYCKSGARSKKATRILQANGFTKIYNLEGGILNWQAKKYKINK